MKNILKSNHNYTKHARLIIKNKIQVKIINYIRIKIKVLKFFIKRNLIKDNIK
jgi:hypothetical protein